jgi:hypothetical protein
MDEPRGCSIENNGIVNLLTLGIVSCVHANTPSRSKGRSLLSSGEVVHVCTESL